MIKAIAHCVFILIFPCSGWAFFRKRHVLTVLICYITLFFSLTILTRWITLPIVMLAVFIHALLAATIAIYIGMRAPVRTKKQYVFAALGSMCVVLIVTGTIAFRASVLGVNLYVIQAQSMEPTLQSGDVIIVDTWPHDIFPIARRDIVLFKAPKRPTITYIKRVAALPGDRLFVSPGKVVLISQEDKPDAHTKKYASNTVVSADQYFVLGDNLSHSRDSRHFGTIKSGSIMGKATAILLNWEVSKGFELMRMAQPLQ